MRLTTRGAILRVSNCLSLIIFAVSVVDNLRLSDGVLFPMPITLDVSRADVDRLAITPGSRICLLDPRDDDALAIITGKFLPAVVCNEVVTFYQWRIFTHQTKSRRPFRSLAPMILPIPLLPISETE